MRGLRKAYGNRVVVDGLDLDVPAGEIVGLIGANGAGKTTTVECIQGLRKPDAGILRVMGYDPVTQAEDLRPLIGSQLQHSALPDRLRVGEAVELFGTRPARDGGELLERFGLEQRRRSAFGSLSGGERQRLFLVLALLNQPRLIILDELTQGLDPAARRNVWAAVRQLHEEGTTTAVACALLLAVAAPVYGLPALHDGWRVAVALGLGAVGFVSLGVLLGTLLPSARSAQAVGLLLFFPSFLLGAGGPPPHVMGAAIRHIASPLPLTLLTNAVRGPWLGLGPATGSLLGLAGLTVVFTALAARRTAL